MNPMAGVTILVKGTTNGTSTDQEGKYSLSANDKDVLVFLFHRLRLRGRTGQWQINHLGDAYRGYCLH
jgi:hypothetical protein